MSKRDEVMVSVRLCPETVGVLDSIVAVGICEGGRAGAVRDLLEARIRGPEEEWQRALDYRTPEAAAEALDGLRKFNRSLRDTLRDANTCVNSLEIDKLQLQEQLDSQKLESAKLNLAADNWRIRTRACMWTLVGVIVATLLNDVWFGVPTWIVACNVPVLAVAAWFAFKYRIAFLHE